MPSPNFNSIKVRLEPLTTSDDNLFVGYFNSIKVRLEREALMTCLSVSRKFQFHKGTIRTQGFSQGAEVCGISIP